MFVYVAAARLSVTSGASPPFHRNWEDSETTAETLRGRYLLPCHLCPCN